MEQSPTGDQLSGAGPIHVSRPLWTVFFRLFCRWVILSYSVFFWCPFPLPLKIFTHILFKYITAPLLPTVCTLVYLSLAVPGLCCCTRARLQLQQAGATLLLWCLSLTLRWLLLLQSMGFRVCGLQQLQLRLQAVGSIVVVHGLGCPETCGIFPDQGLNQCPLNWQADL